MTAAPRLTFKAVFEGPLSRGEKTVTIRLGDRTDCYAVGQLVPLLLTDPVGHQVQIGLARIEHVRPLALRDISAEDLGREGTGITSHSELIALLMGLYQEDITEDTLVTLIRFTLIRDKYERR